MKLITLSFALSLILLFSSKAYSQVTCNNTSICTGPAKQLISQLFATQSGGGRLLIVTSPTLVQRLPCIGDAGGPNVTMRDSNLAFEETYALLLAAYLSNSRVSLRIDTNQARCTILNARLNS